MSAIHIFKAGTHTDMHGKKLPFTPDDLAACVKAYDPSVHEAPLVIGHPRTEDPAWGWVKALSLSGVDLMAEPAQLDPQFAEMVTDGRFKKVSASFYLPDSPSNPKPGVLYLRHVGFLGAQPPSVKGLKQVSFSEQEEGVVEFADWQAITNASLWGKLRDFLIARFSLDEAEKVLPEWQLNSLREEAYRDTLSQDAAGAQFSETGPGPSSASNEESSMTKEEIEALQEENRRLKQQAADRDARDAQVRQEQLHKDNVAFAEKLVAEGRLAQDEKVYRTGHVKKLTASDRWAGGKGDPIGVIEAGMEAVRTATGLRPNLMTMGAGVMALLKFHPAIQAAIGANERKRITTEILQDLFQIEEIVIGAPVSLPSMKAAMDKNSVPADIWGDNLMLHYVGKPQPGADSADENEPSFGYTLRRKGMPVADKYDGAGGKVKYCRYTDIYKVAVVGGDAGYLITGISK